MQCVSTMPLGGWLTAPPKVTLRPATDMVCDAPTSALYSMGSVHRLNLKYLHGYAKDRAAMRSG